MIFTCRSCGANITYNPAKMKMVCEHCGSEDSEQQAGDRSITNCASCGAPVTINNLTSASKCSHCGNYLIFDERIEGAYKPELIIPFQISKTDAVDRMKKEFKARAFTPSTFLSEATLVGMNGFYVPFFMYDYDVNIVYQGEGKKVRTWTSGNYRYTENSYYAVLRDMNIKFDNIPVDASFAMDDTTMDLIEPFDYQYLMDFAPKYLSGFFGEIYNADAGTLEYRAKNRATEDSESLLNTSMSYSSVRTISKQVNMDRTRADFALLPVWMYIYNYAGKSYRYYVNGQTGKIIGKTPISKKKVFFYSAGLAVILASIMNLFFTILEVL